MFFLSNKILSRWKFWILEWTIELIVLDILTLVHFVLFANLIGLLHLQILVKSFLFLFWKNMTTLRTLYWTQILENVPKPKKLSLCIYFCMNVIYDLVDVVAKILVHFHLPRGDHHQNVKTTLTSWHVVFYSRVGTDRKRPWICVTNCFHLKSTITISVGMWAGYKAPPFV